MAQANGDLIAQNLAEIVADNPGRNIYMGYGDGSRYTVTFLRTELAYAGHPYLIDAAALMDFQHSGMEIPQVTIDHMLADKSSIWLIPAGQEPFEITNWYYRFQGRFLFEDNFRSAFNESFQRHSSTDFFDLYIQRNQNTSEP
jgi:hypothetical protein